MKTYLLLLLLLISVNVFAQEKMLTEVVPAPQFKKSKLADTLSPENFKRFNYITYTRQKDSIKLTNATTKFKKRLIVIDWLIANNQIKLINQSKELGISINMLNDSIIDNIKMTFSKKSIGSFEYNEQKDFKFYINQLNLTNLDSLLKKTKNVEYIVMTSSYIQVDELRDIRIASEDNNQLYATLLLKHIHEKLKKYKEQLGNYPENIYETEYEPSGLTLTDKIKKRETFIRYVNSLLNP